MAYHAFMSYSHAADGRLAPALQTALHRFAKPWYRLRALRVFRDKTSLHPTPELWHAIASAIDQSAYFILLASPEAAASAWVRREIDHWLDARPADRILIVLTSGSLQWNAADESFDAGRTTALPPRLMRAFAQEPLYLDLSWTDDRDEGWSRDPRFHEAVAELAAAIHGRSKDELFGEDVRQHRRTRRLAASAIGGLCALTIVSAAAAFIAVTQRNAARAQRAEAVAQSRIALSRQLAAQSTNVRTQFPDRLPLAVLLALESTRLQDSFESNQALRAGLTLLPRAVLTYASDPSAPMRDRIRALAFSADRRHLVIGRDDGTATVLDVGTGKPIAILSHDERQGAVVDLPRGGIEWKAPGTDAEVTSVGFSPDGRLVATGGNDGTARLWDVSTGREVRRLHHDGPVSSVAFHPTGAYLATGSKDKTLRVFEVAGGRQTFARRHEREVRTRTLALGGRGTLEETVSVSTVAEEVREVAFSPDGRVLAAISTDGGVSVSDAKSGMVRHAWYAGVSGLGLAFSRDGTMLATANGDFAFVWDVPSGKQVFEATHAASREDAIGHLMWIDDVAFSPDGRLLATGGRDGTARTWNLRTGQEATRLPHAGPVDTVAFGHDATTLVTGSYDGSRLWELPFGHERWRAGGANEIVEFSVDGSLVAAGGSDGFVSVLNLGPGDQPVRLVHPDAVTTVSMSPDGGTLAIATDGALRLSSPDGAPMASPVKPLYGIRNLVFSEDGRFLAGSGRNPYLFVLDLAGPPAPTSLVTSREVGEHAVSARYVAAVADTRREVRLWDTRGGGERPRIAAENLVELAFDPTGAFLALRSRESRGEHGSVRVWDVPASRLLGAVSFTGDGPHALSPHGRLLAIAGREEDTERSLWIHYVEVMDVATGAPRHRLPAEDVVAAMAFDPSGERLVTIAGNVAEQRRHALVWDAATGALKARLTHAASIAAVRFNRDGDMLATLSGGRVYVWSASTGVLLTQVADTAHIVSFRFSADGRRLLTGSTDGIAALWLLNTADLRGEACARLTRNLSSAEWQQYLGAVPYERSCPNLPSGEER